MSDPVVDGKSTDHTTEREPQTWLRLALVLLAVGLIGAGVICLHWPKADALKKVSAGIQAQQPAIGTFTAELQSWQATLAAVGSLTASNGADLQLEISGVIEEIPFESGEDVAAGVLLLRLRPDNNDALLLQLQATAHLDEITYRRDAKQFAIAGRGIRHGRYRCRHSQGRRRTGCGPLFGAQVGGIMTSIPESAQTFQIETPPSRSGASH